MSTSNSACPEPSSLSLCNPLFQPTPNIPDIFLFQHDFLQLKASSILWDMCCSFSLIFHIWLLTQAGSPAWPCLLKSSWKSLLFSITCFIYTLSLISPFQWSHDSYSPLTTSFILHFATRTVKYVHVIFTPKTFYLILAINKSFNNWVWHLRFFMPLFHFFYYPI